jgi:hypothetical protein
VSGYDDSLPPDDGGWTATAGDDDPHADCIQPHTRGDGEHYDCDGRSL